MNNVMATGFHTRTSVVLVVICLAISQLAIPFVARAGGGDSTDRPPLSPAHRLPGRAYSSHAYPPGFDRSTRVVQSSRSHAVAQPRCGDNRPSRSGERHRESTADLAQRINQLAKDFSPRGRRELATAIDKLPKDQRFYDAAPKHLALLSNGIGKLLDGQGDQPAAIRVLNTLAREVSRRDLGGRLWQPQNLALVVNGLSKGTGDDITGALKAVAREIVHRDLSHWTSQSLALVVCGIRKTEGKQITDCLNVLVREFVHQDLHRWQSQHLAMLASGISRAEGEALIRALSALARAMIDRQPELGQWAERQLAMVVGGLSKGEGEQINRALNMLAQAVIDRKRQLGQWAVQSLTMVVNGLSKGEGAAINKALRVLAQAVTDRKQGLDQWTGLQLAMVVNGLSKGEGKEISKALRVLAQTVTDRKHELNQWTGQQLAMVVNGLSKGEGKEISKAFRVLAQAVVAQQQGLDQWAGHHLAMVVNGLSRGEGEEITKALNVLAQAVIDQQWLLARWKEQHLAMVVNGLSKGVGEEITRALNVLAQEVSDRWPALGQWTIQQLAMVVNGLSKDLGHEHNSALNVLAQAVTERQQELGQWAEQQLAMVVSGLSKGSGEEITKALRVLAQAVTDRKQELGQWKEQHLAMVSGGIGKGTGAEIAPCLKTLALEIAVRDLGQWTSNNLAMAASGIGKISQHPVFAKLINELVKHAAQEPPWLLTTLKNLCRFQLSREQVEAALLLLDALHRSRYRPVEQDAQDELRWCLTLVHFSHRYLLAAFGSSHNHRDQLAELYRYYVEQGESGGKTDRVVDQRSYQAGSDSEQELGAKRWHNLFSRDYWQGEHRQQSRGTPSPTVFSSAARGSVSQLQMNSYQAIKNRLLSHQVEMEVSINHFPVDIMIDRRICIEVDGSSHYFPPQQSPNSQSRAAESEHGDSAVSVLPSLPGERRAKDRFIDYMLAQYGYRVFRIPYTYQPESPEFQQIIDQIQMSLTDKKSSRFLPRQVRR